jgi:hypothetical protein
MERGELFQKMGIVGAFTPTIPIFWNSSEYEMQDLIDRLTDIQAKIQHLQVRL